VSYISCGSIVCYDDGELAAFQPKLVGKLSIPHLQGLYQAIARSDTMEQWQIMRVCNALKVIL
jgi:hypothetical protein